MKRTTGTSRRLAAVLATAMAVGLLAPLLAMTSAQAVQDTTTSRIAGNDRYATAAAVATTAFPDGASSVVLATGSDFADALSASGLAGAIDAPVLLTLRDSLPASTIDALETLAPDDVFIIGGTSAISADVQTTLEGSGYTVERFAGEDRFSTAAAVGDAIADTDDGNPLTDGDGVGSTDDGVTAIVASGTSFPDAVSASQLAFGGRFPILLTTRDAVPPTTLDALDRLGIEHVLVIGGTAAVSDGAEGAIENEGISTARLAGTTRWGTSVAVAEFAGVALEFGGPTVYLATGQAFPDALGGGVISGVNTAPLLLTGTNSVPDELAAYLVDNGSAVDNIVALGGTAAISAATLADAAAAAKLDTNQVFDVDPGGSQIKDESANGLDNTGRVNYTANGLTSGTEYVIGLVDPNTVFTSGSTTSFTSYTLSDDASTSIETVNGTPNFTAGSGNESQQTTGTADADGVITFTVDATEPDSVIPVVFLDEDDNGELTLNGSAPTDPFGIGGRTSWLPTEAAAGTYNLTVSEINRAENYFLASVGTPSVTRAFFYGGSGDGYAYISIGADQAQFEGMLSVRDELRVIYDPEGASNFRVDTDDIPDISDAIATVVTNGEVLVSWTPSSQGDVVYDVVRQEDGAVIADDISASSKTDTSLSGVTVARYQIIPKGSFSGTVDDTNDDQGPLDDFSPYFTNGVKPSVIFQLFDNGVTVELDPGAEGAQRGDAWLMHFSRAVTLQNSPSLTLDLDGDGDLTDGTATVNKTVASFTVVNGSSVRVVFDTAVADISYGDTEVASISGFRNGTSDPVMPGSDDLVINHNGPELMAKSSSCVVGATTCSITFNEVVTASSAEDMSNYSFNPGTDLNGLTGISLGTDGRTITMTFQNDLAGDATLDPGNGTTGVADSEDGQVSNQSPVDLTS